MAKHVSTLERTVADRELLGSSPASAIELQKFVRLYDMILEAYKNKLRKQKQLKNSLFCQESPENQNQPTFNPMSHGELPNPSISINGFVSVEDNNPMNVAFDPLGTGAEVEVEEDVNLSFSPDNMESEEEGQSYHNYFEDERDAADDDNEWNLEQSMNANDDNEGNSTLIISNVQLTATSSSPSTATAASSSGGGGRSRNRVRVSTRAAAAKKRKRKAYQAPSASAAAVRNAAGANVGNTMEIKEEVLVENDDGDEEEEGDATSADVYKVAERKRRSFFEDVEIFKCNGTGRTKDDEFLQCSDCPFTLSNRKLTKKEGQSPYGKIKMHIQNVHKNNPGPLKPRAPSQFICGVCNITFPNLVALKAHNRTHPVPEALPCNICGRSVKGGYHNLMLHKFSHKNDDERRISLANNERGSYPAFLSDKLTSLYYPRKKNGESVNSSSASRNRNKINRNRSRNSTTAAIAGSSNDNVSVTTTPINTAATRSARAARRSGSTATAEVDDGLAKPYGCRICNECFSKKNHLVFHMRFHGYRKGERGQPQPQEEGGEPIPSTSAASVAEQSIGAGIASRRRQAAMTSQPPPPTEVSVPTDPEGDGLGPPQLSPQETAELAASIESSIEEVCGEMGISVDGIDAGEGEEEGELVAPVLKREDD